MDLNYDVEFNTDKENSDTLRSMRTYSGNEPSRNSFNIHPSENKKYKGPYRTVAANFNVKGNINLN
jgi:hypothetical protein